MALPIIEGTYKSDTLLKAPASEAHSIFGYSGHDRIVGSSKGDALFGGSSEWHEGGLMPGYQGAYMVHIGDDDTISAGGGDDQIFVGTGRDSIVGGSGYDTLNFYYNAHAEFIEVVDVGGNPPLKRFDSHTGWLLDIMVDLSAGTYSGVFKDDGDFKVIGNASGTFSGIEAIIGGVGRDTMYGSSGNDFFKPIKGADVVDGRGGTDILSYEDAGTLGIVLNFGTGKAVDTFGHLDTFTNIEIAIGSKQADDMTGTVGTQIFVGGNGADTIDGVGGRDLVDYSRELGTGGISVLMNKLEAKDTFGAIDEIRNIENIKGTKVRDVITGNDADNSFWGEDGNDNIGGSGGADTLYGGAGKDTLGGGADDDDLHGNEGNDALVGGAGNDTLDGGADDDGLKGNDGTDVLAGGDGDDTIDGGEGYDTITGGKGNDSITAGGKIIFGVHDLPETIHGDDGNDTITGGVGDDKIFGDAGDDVLVDFRTPVEYDVDDGDGNEIDGGSGNDKISGQGALHGGADNDTIEGAGHLFGDDGNDTIKVGPTDQFEHHGAVRMEGGAGKDTLIDSFDHANDWHGVASYAYATQGIIALLDGDRVTAGAGDVDTLQGIIAVSGSAFDDTMTGTSGQEFLYGEKGADSLRAMGGADVLDGGAGKDTIDAGAGDNTVRGGGDDDSIRAGKGNDSINGDGGNDTIYGGGGTDSLYGGAGADRIFVEGRSDHQPHAVVDGGAGKDILTSSAGGRVFFTGGGGKDSFVFEHTPLGGFAIITDFDSAIEQIDLRSLTAQGLGHSFATLKASAEDTGDGVVIHPYSGFEIVIADMTKAELRANDFLI